LTRSLFLFLPDIKALLMRRPATVVQHGSTAFTLVHMREGHINAMMAELFKVFGDTTRIKILYALFASEMCVCDIAALINMTQSAVSHQLRVLKQARLVKYRKEGKVVYYSLDDDHINKYLTKAICI